MIEVEGLEKTYADTRAVDGLSFRVDAGEILGLLGPNGAGKTTTLRAIAGVLPPSRGRIVVGGHDLEKEPIAAKRLLAYVPDDPKLFDNLTCWEHLRFIARAYGVADFATHAEALLRRFELLDKRDALGSELSRGMRQKLASACALLHSPSLLLFDEPMTGLDPRGIRNMNELIREQAARGAAVIVSSHLLSMVEKLCTQVLVLHHGRSLLFGRIAEVRARFPDLSGDASLEDVFFRATEASPVAEGVATPGNGTTTTGRDDAAGP